MTLFKMMLLALAPATAIIGANAAYTVDFGVPSASDGTVKELLGVIAGPDAAAAKNPNNGGGISLTPQYQAVGVTGVRNNDYFDDRLDMEQIFNCGGPTYPSWEGCDANDDRFYNWTLSDKQFQSWLDGGFEPFLRLGNETACGCRTRDFNGPQNAVQEDNWIIAAKKVVGRYNSWKGGANVLRYVDIWTEWPNERFYDRPLEDFPVFWAKALLALKAAYPGLKIGGPGMLAGSTNQPTLDFLTYMYQHNAKPDWIGFHVFSVDPETFLTEARNYRELLSGTGQFASVPWAGTGFFNGVELICDAYFQGSKIQDANGKTRDMTREESDQFNNHQRGAARNAASWIALQYADIERAYYYRGDDGTSQPGADPKVMNSPLGGPGLFYGDGKGTAKPKANAFRFFSRMYREFPALLANAAVGSGDVWAMGAQSEDGSKKAVLVSNTGDAAVDLNVKFAGMAASPEQFTRVDVYTVDDGHDGTGAAPWSGGALTVAADTVELIVFASSEEPAPAAPGDLATTSAASFQGTTVAPGSIAAAYGSGLAAAVEVSASASLPEAIEGTSVSVKDSGGVDRAAGLYFVSPGQVNFLVPEGSASGAATVLVRTGSTVTASGAVTIAKVAPGIFSAAGNGLGVAAANVVRVKAGGEQSLEQAATLTAAQKWLAVPIDLGPETEQVYLILYGTGIRNSAKATAMIGGAAATVTYAEAQGVFAGLDQVNLLIPRSLAGRGVVDVILTADGIAANPVQINVR